jgi:hypothetical protein
VGTLYLVTMRVLTDTHEEKKYALGAASAHDGLEHRFVSLQLISRIFYVPERLSQLERYTACAKL